MFAHASTRAESASLLAHESTIAIDICDACDIESRGRSRSSAKSSNAPRVAMAAATLAGLGAIAVWTHKAKTLQEAWRPVPGMDSAHGSNDAVGIARWSKTTSSLGAVGLSSGIVTTPSQIGQLSALRMQIRTAMFDPATSASTVQMLTKQFILMVPDVASMFPSGSAASAIELDDAVKSLMTQSAVASPAPASVEGEFRKMISEEKSSPYTSRGFEVPIHVNDDGRAESLTQQPASTYETALRETKNAAEQDSWSTTSASEMKHHKSHHATKEQSALDQNENLQGMINSLDAVDGVKEEEAQQPYSYESEALRSAESVEVQPAASAAAAQSWTRPSWMGGVRPDWEPETTEAGVLSAPQPEIAQEQPQPQSEIAQEPPQPVVEASMPASMPAATTTDSSLDDSWLSFKGDEVIDDAEASSSVNSLAQIPNSGVSLEKTVQAAQAVVQVPAPAADTQPDKALVNAITDALGGETIDSILSSGDLGVKEKQQQEPSIESSASTLKLNSPLELSTDAEAIAINVVQLIKNRIKLNSETASVGADESNSATVATKTAPPQLSKEEIAEVIAKALSASAMPVVQENVLKQVEQANADSEVDPNTKIIADAMVEHDQRTARRIADILAADDGVQLVRDRFAATANAGDSELSTSSSRKDEAAELIMYEEQRRAREEIQAMRRDLSVLMANIQANAAMGMTENKIDKTASAAAGHIIETLRPELGIDGAKSSSMSKQTFFEYPTMPSPKLTKSSLALDGLLADSKSDAKSAFEFEDKNEDEKVEHDESLRGWKEPSWLKSAVSSSSIQADLVDADVEDTVDSIFAIPESSLGSKAKSTIDHDGTIELPGYRVVKSAKTKSEEDITREVHELIRKTSGGANAASRQAAAPHPKPIRVDEDDDEYEIDSETTAQVKANSARLKRLIKNAD